MIILYFVQNFNKKCLPFLKAMPTAKIYPRYASCPHNTPPRCQLPLVVQTPHHFTGSSVFI